MNPNGIKKVLVTGGAGYVGAALVPALLNEGYEVVVYDLYIYKRDLFRKHQANPRLIEVQADIRDVGKLKESLQGVDAVIHLACISNDPSFELNPNLGKSINFDCFEPMVKAAKAQGVKRFVYASSSSVYGIKEEENVTEDLPLEPLTDYSKFKALCEEVLLKEATPEFTSLIVRPATVCGYSDRLRLDLTVNIFTNHAVTNGEIKIFGGKQKRPNIHIDDMVSFYLQSLNWTHGQIHKQIFNVGYDNFSLDEIAEMVRSVTGDHVKFTHTPSNDNRSYRVSSARIKNALGFTPKRDIRQAAKDLYEAFKAGKIPNAMTDSTYYNIKKMQEIELN